ncbi:hypothetical protein [Streptomyces sp. NPDC046870]|uniref:hypothetical protein n=1 Tax=Streptomyces sp. NPDC046870 TaxID=3155135 RepID=UPI003455F90E
MFGERDDSGQRSSGETARQCRGQLFGVRDSNKTGRFPIAERLARLREAATGLSNITVDSHTGGLLVDYCRQVGIDVVVRGVRGVRDLDHEMPMARMNHELAGLETFFIAADPALAHISSTLVTSMSQKDDVPKDQKAEAASERPARGMED